MANHTRTSQRTNPGFLRGGLKRKREGAETHSVGFEFYVPPSLFERGSIRTSRNRDCHSADKAVFTLALTGRVL